MNPSNGNTPTSGGLGRKFQSWWWRGSSERPTLDAKVTSHVEGILDHAADIQRAAELEGQRIRRDAIESAARMLTRIRAVEEELENALAAVADAKVALQDGIVAERAQLEGDAPVAQLRQAS